MNRDAWVAHIVWSVSRAAQANPMRLHAIAQLLADTDTARESLQSAGYGTEDGGILECVAAVVEGKPTEPLSVPL